MRAPWPDEPPPGPFRREFWRSPLRGPWLTAVLGSALLPLILICALTGLASHLAYLTELGGNAVFGTGIDLYFFDWPTSPSWLYALTQGLHVGTGMAAIPLLLAKLWSVMPKLFEWPPLRSPAHLLDRLSLALLVGGSVFVFFTGVLNIQNWYPWPFSFIGAHYWASFVFLGALGLHLVTKIPIARAAFRERGLVAPFREGAQQIRPDPPIPDTTAPVNPGPATISRRALLGTVGAGSLGLALIAAGQSIGGPFRKLAILAPRGLGAEGAGPNDFPINKTAVAGGIERSETGEGWRLVIEGTRRVELSREQLLAMPQTTESLPIACVEGWSTTQAWTGVRIRELAAFAGLDDAEQQVTVSSLQQAGSFREATLSAGQAADPRTLLALRVNGADLSLDHGYPARLIGPAIPGVHCTKWVSSIRFGEQEAA